MPMAFSGSYALAQSNTETVGERNVTKRQMSCEQALNMLGPSGYRKPGTTAGNRPTGSPAQSRPGTFNPIWLRREGDTVIVAIEVDGKWIDIIHEVADSPFSHIWEGRALPEGGGGES